MAASSTDSVDVPLRLAVGDSVAYPPHGVARVVRSGQEVVALELADGLSVLLPLELARQLLRPLASEADLRAVERTLRRPGPPGEEDRAVRMRQAREKLKRGQPLELAEIVRDGARLEELAANHTGPKLSVGEVTLCKDARKLLADEIGFVRDLECAQADAWIEEQLSPIHSGPKGQREGGAHAGHAERGRKDPQVVGP